LSTLTLRRSTTTSGPSPFKPSTERERKGLHTRIEKLDLERSIRDPSQILS
jgi:hypothetical protein